MVTVVLVSSAVVLTVYYCLLVASNVPCLSRITVVLHLFAFAQHGIPRVPDS